MKKLLLLLTFCLSIISGFSQLMELTGKVVIHNSQYKTGKTEYVQNAYVSADFATPDDTDETGVYNLNFQGLANGTSVELSAEKEGLEVVNNRDLLDVVIPRNRELTIYMAEKGALAKAQTELYQINLKSITAEYDQFIERLKTDQEAALTELRGNFQQEIENRWDAEELLRKQLDETKKRLPAMAKKYARINLDIASDNYRRAYEAFKLGQLDSVIFLLDSNTLNAKANLATIDTLVRQRAVLDFAISENERIILQKIEGLELVSQAYELKFEFKKSSEAYLKKIKILEELEIYPSELAIAYDNYSLIMSQMGNPKQALLWSKKAVALGKKVKTSKYSPEVFSLAYSNLSNHFHFLFQEDSALVYNRKAIKILKQNGIKIERLYAQNYNRISGPYRRIGQYDSAFFFIRKAIQIHQTSVIDNPLDELSIYYLSLGACHEDVGAYDSAQFYTKKSIEISQNINPRPLRRLAYGYSLISGYLSSEGQQKYMMGDTSILKIKIMEALPYIRRSIRIQENILDPLHPDLAFSYSAIAELYSILQNWTRINSNNTQLDSALFYARKALHIQEKSLGLTHPALAPNYIQVGVIMAIQEDFDSAIVCFNKAKGMYQNSPNSSSTLASTYGNLAIAYSEKADFDSAYKYLCMKVNIYENSFGSESSFLIPEYQNLASILVKAGKVPKAIEYIEKSLFILNKQEKEIEGEEGKTVIDMAIELYENRLAQLKEFGANKSSQKAIAKRLKELQKMSE